MNWAEFLTYDESSPSGLRWAVDRAYGKKYARVRVRAGDVTGSINARGYWCITFDKKSYLAHRVIWELVNKVKLRATEHIDHIDGDPTNNLASNLRVVTRSTNMQNKRKGTNNTSGFCGARLDYKPNGSGIKKLYAASMWKEGGKQRRKTFSVETYGLLPAFAKACAHREQSINQLNAKGANYSDRHGK